MFLSCTGCAAGCGTNYPQAGSHHHTVTHSYGFSSHRPIQPHAASTHGGILGLKLGSDIGNDQLIALGF